MSEMLCCAVVTCLIFWLFSTILAERIDLEDKLGTECRIHIGSCSECLNFHSACSWCNDMNFDIERCDLTKNLNGSCKSIKVGKQSKQYVQQNDKFQDITDTINKAIQIRPQKVMLQLRPGDTETIKLKYRVAKNYPLDLYYLMDSTYTMRDDVETIVNLGDELSHSLSQLTKFVRVGFGRFSDKVSMPFARMDDASLKNPCKGAEEGTCSPAFDFKHDFNLNSNIKQFIEKVNLTKVTANLDNAEGALDALLQVIVCNEKIGWQHEARKLVIILTNGVLHFAGDGKLAGVTKKADGLCHLDENGFYTESNKQDYPSLSQIYTKLKKHKMNVIFAVTEDVLGYYKKLNNVIPDFSYVTQLHSDSSNILNVIRKGYEEALATATFQDNSQNPVKIDYYSRCNKDVPILNNTNSCYGVEKGDTYEFNINITLDSCPDDKAIWKQRIVIDEKLIDTESLVIDLEMLCGCDCPNLGNNMREQCNKNGEIRCGVCECDKGWSGEKCDCDTTSFQNTRESENQCRQISGDSISVMCSGRGDCVCGKCICEPQYTGKYCECKPCKKVNGHQCGGPKHGWCDCGECACQPEYMGTDCICPVANDSCIAPGDEQICSGHGQCECGKCKCQTGNFTYTGDYCEKCSTCGGLCRLYDKCVKCTILNNCKQGECFTRSINNIDFVDVLQDSSISCLVRAEKESCIYWQYVYEINRNNTVDIQILSVNCEPIKMSEFAIYIFFVVFCAGLVLIGAFKIKLVIENKREFARYQKNLEMTTYNSDDNPLYISPKTYYEVPRMKED